MTHQMCQLLCAFCQPIWITGPYYGRLVDQKTTKTPRHEAALEASKAVPLVIEWFRGLLAYLTMEIYAPQCRQFFCRQLPALLTVY